VEGPFYHRAAHTTSIATVPSEPFINPDIELPVAPHEPVYILFFKIFVCEISAKLKLIFAFRRTACVKNRLMGP